MNTSTALTAARFKEAARNCGADLVGIAPMDRFNEVADDHNPAQIAPDARSVIVIGRRIPRGSLRGVEEGTQFGLYRKYGYDWLDNRFLATATYKTAEFLEDSGYEAVPLPNLPPQMNPLGVPVSDTKPAPNVLVDFNDAAVRAGLGEIDFGGFLITPEFGTRQRIQLILTEAELKPDPLSTDRINDCPPKKYASFCPFGAIDPDKTVTRTICGREYETADIDLQICHSCKNGAVPNMYHDSGQPDRISALCGRSVLSYLEKNDRLAASFRNPFRKRAFWCVSGDHVYLEDGSEIE